MFNCSIVVRKQVVGFPLINNSVSRQYVIFGAFGYRLFFQFRIGTGMNGTVLKILKHNNELGFGTFRN